MSVNLMSSIFEVEFFDIKDAEGNVTKASTAKLVLLAMADHANDEGEGAYPSIERLCKKTALSEQTIRNTFDALRHNGIIELSGKSKYGTNNHTINTKSFPRAIGKEVTVLTLYPLDPLTSGEKGSNGSPELVLPVIPESLLTTKETSLPKGDLVDFELSKLPAMTLRQAIHEYFRLNVNWETKTARQWMEWAVGENITTEQIRSSAELWRSDKAFNWQTPTLKGIFEKWPALMDAIKLVENNNQREQGKGFYA